MDNPAVPIPSISPQPAVESAIASSAETSTRRWILWLTGGLFVLILGIAIGGFSVKFLSQSQGQSPLTSIPTPAQSPTPTPPSDPTANWKTYNNDFYNLRFFYSPAYTIEENQTGGGFQIIINKGKDSEIAVGVSLQNIGQLDTFLDTPSRGKTTIGENTWLEFFLPQGYQDAGDTNTKPIYALKIAKGDFIYTARIFGSSLTKEQNQILSTFKFLNNTNDGTLEATVIRSPTCGGPVTEQQSCEAPYANGTFYIISFPDNKIKQTINSDTDGKFTILLAPGAYNLQNTESGKGKNINNPSFRITIGKTTIQRFDVGTGLR